MQPAVPLLQPVFRFAPSPNGRLHLGHAYSALLNEALAAAHQGRFLLRMEDIDTTRCTPELAQHCLDDLHWLGIIWEKPVRVQSHHFSDYQQALSQLERLVYPCFCSRSDIAKASHASDPDGAPLYPGTCKSLNIQQRQSAMASGTPHSWRLDMDSALKQAGNALSYQVFDTQTLAQTQIAADPARWGDVILSRKDTPTSYHLSVVTDDALQGITHVVRGQDLEAATDLHVLLQHLLGLPSPAYYHHGLITDDGGDKLSKSKSSRTLADLRAEGITAQQIRSMLGF